MARAKEPDPIVQIALPYSQMRELLALVQSYEDSLIHGEAIVEEILDGIRNDTK